MPYRRYAKKKMVRRKKRIYRRKKMFGRRKADRGHLEKITKTVALTVDAGGQIAQHVVHWLATGVSGQLDTYVTGGGVNASQQFTQCTQMYRDYYISSVRIDYRPVLFDMGNAG